MACLKGISAVKKHIDDAISYTEFSKNFNPENKTIGNNFADKLIKNNHVIKQLNNTLEKNKGTNITNPNQSFKGVVQSDQHNKKMGLDLEI